MKNGVMYIVCIACVAFARVSPSQSLPRFVSVTAGAQHACALSDSGEAYCWGANDAGQLGIGSADSAAHGTPAPVGGRLRFRALAAGYSHTCGLTADGTAYCWGANESAQLGDGTIERRATPVRVAFDKRFRTIAPGGTHTCALSADSLAYCWGGNWHGQLGDGTRSGDSATPCCHRAPVPVSTRVAFAGIVAGGIHTCAVTSEGSAFCWGTPQEGRLGSGADDAKDKTKDKTTPVAVIGGLHFATIIPRSWHTCALTSAGDAYCWGGIDGRGILGTGDIDASNVSAPARVSSATRFATLAVGVFHTCALSADGGAYCWGANIDGAVDPAVAGDAASPRRIFADRRFTSIAAGGSLAIDKTGRGTKAAFTCAVDDAGAVRCWGSNTHGERAGGDVPHRGPEARHVRATSPTVTAEYSPSARARSLVRG